MDQLKRKNFIYVREQQPFTFDDLRQIFTLSAESLAEVIRDLKAGNVLKAVKKSASGKDFSELAEKDFAEPDEQPESADVLYLFTYVGILRLAGKVLLCYPKYIRSKPEPVDEMKQVIRVLEKYSRSQEQSVRLFSENTDRKSFNPLGLYVYLMEDYAENGLYSNPEKILESNGSGAINWNRTINETYAFIRNGRPYYTDLRTEKRVDDLDNYFRKLHECVITLISEEMEEYGLNEFFNLEYLELSESDLKSLGDTEYILYRLQNEINVQFNTRKNLLLKALYAYISVSGNASEIELFSTYGSTAFNMVWEEVCARVLGDQLDVPLKEINFPIRRIDDTGTLRSNIEAPLWTFRDHPYNSDTTLRPDYAAVKKLGNETWLVIFDAKYYVMSVRNGKLAGNPGVESVTKQYLYQLAYLNFMEDHGINKAINCFLMPSTEEKYEHSGTVQFSIFDGLEKNGKPAKLKPVQLIQLPPSLMYEKYLSGDIIELEQLPLEQNLHRAEKEAVSAGTYREMQLPEEEIEEDYSNIIWLPVIGETCAGYGLEVEENILGYLPADKTVVNSADRKKQFYVLVDGESMINAGINSGDAVLIRRSSQKYENDIVLARVNSSESTIKRLHREENGVTLFPENEEFEPISISAELFESGEADIVGVEQWKYRIHDARTKMKQAYELAPEALK